MKVEVIKNNLVITVPINSKPFKPSASGKTLQVATTNGNQKTGIELDGKELIVGINAYITNK